MAIGSKRSDVSVHDGVAFVELDRLIISVWQRSPTVARLQWWIDTVEKATRRYPNEVIVLSVIMGMGSGSSQNPGVREFARKEVSRLAPSIRRFVILSLVDSMMGPLVRSIIRTMFMLNPATRHFKLVGTEDDAIDAVAMPGGPSRREVAAALNAAIDAAEKEKAVA